MKSNLVNNNQNNFISQIKHKKENTLCSLLQVENFLCNLKNISKYIKLYKIFK